MCIQDTRVLIILKASQAAAKNSKTKAPLAHEGADALEAGFDRPAAPPNAGPQGTEANNMSRAGVSVPGFRVRLPNLTALGLRFRVSGGFLNAVRA